MYIYNLFVFFVHSLPRDSRLQVLSVRPCVHNSCIHYVNRSFVTLCLFFVRWLKLKLKPDDKIVMRLWSLFGRKKNSFYNIVLTNGNANKKAFELGADLALVDKAYVAKDAEKWVLAQWDASINDWKLKFAVIYSWMLPVRGQVLNAMTPPPTLS